MAQFQGLLKPRWQEWLKSKQSGCRTWTRFESVLVLRHRGSSWEPTPHGAGDNEALEFLLMNRLIYGLPSHPGVFGFMEWGANMRHYSVGKVTKVEKGDGESETQESRSCSPPFSHLLIP